MLNKYWYYKEKFHADHRWGLKGTKRHTNKNSTLTQDFRWADANLKGNKKGYMIKCSWFHLDNSVWKNNTGLENASALIFWLRDWLWNLAMKTMVQQFMLEGLRPCTILCFNVHTTVEHLNRNVSIGQLLQHISKSNVVSARSRPKMLTKTYNRFHNHCFLLTILKLTCLGIY